jgi:hypothetical protein
MICKFYQIRGTSPSASPCTCTMACCRPRPQPRPVLLQRICQPNLVSFLVQEVFRRASHFHANQNPNEVLSLLIANSGKKRQFANKENVTCDASLA